MRRQLSLIPRSWRDLGEVLGLPDQLVYLDEPGVPATLDQLATPLPSLVPDRLDDLIASGAVEACGPDRYCVPRPSLLQLTIDALAAGYVSRQVLAMLQSIGQAAIVADAAISLLGDPPPDADHDRLVAFAERGRVFGNAASESFHSTLEFELLRKNRFATKVEARAAVAGYIDRYNRIRRHSSCEMNSPIEFEALLAGGAADTVTAGEAA